MKDFLDLADLRPETLNGILELALRLKAETARGALEPYLAGKVMAMVFMKPSLRTRVSFDVAMLQLGGNALYLSPAEVGLGSRESVPDVARVLSGYVDVVMARVFDHADVVQLAEHASVPVINGLSDHNHPCQAVADLLTVREHFGSLAGRKLVYLGDGNNVAHSLLTAGALSGMSVCIVHPSGYAPDDRVLERAAEIAAETGGSAWSTTDRSAVEGADVLYTDVWASMGQESEAEARRVHFEPYRLDHAKLSSAAPDAIVLHCLPAHRGDEIDDAAMDSPQSRVFEQAENRLHAQRAILAWLVGGVELPG